MIGSEYLHIPNYKVVSILVQPGFCRVLIFFSSKMILIVLHINLQLAKFEIKVENGWT